MCVHVPTATWQDCGRCCLALLTGHTTAIMPGCCGLRLASSAVPGPFLTRALNHHPAKSAPPTEHSSSGPPSPPSPSPRPPSAVKTLLSRPATLSNSHHSPLRGTACQCARYSRTAPRTADHLAAPQTPTDALQTPGQASQLTPTIQLRPPTHSTQKRRNLQPHKPSQRLVPGQSLTSAGYSLSMRPP